MKKSYLLSLAVALVSISSLAHGADYVVIANHSVKTSEVSTDELRDVFDGAKTSLKDGSHAVPVTLKGGSAHEAFLKDVVGKSDGAFRAGWRSLVFTGQASLPKTLDSESSVVDYVAATPGAVGYVGSSTKHDSVKTLEVK